MKGLQRHNEVQMIIIIDVENITLPRMITHSSVNIRQTNQSKEHQKNSDQKQKITEAFDPRLNTKIPTLSPHPKPIQIQHTIHTN